jgi:UDP-N-acetyl-D-glucosamine dehydrogenase
MDILQEKMESKTAWIGVIGLGYVGLPLVRAFCLGGFRVKGFDIDPWKVEQLNQGKSYIRSFSIEDLECFRLKNQFSASTDFSRLGEMDGILICVPTPLDKMKQPDLRAVRETAQSIQKTLRKGQLIVLESTTYPGTTEEEFLPLMEAQGFRVGEEVFLAYSPEREDPGNPHYSMDKIPKVVGGYSPKCLRLAQILYAQVVPKVIPVSNLKTAEACKILENIYRCVNIAMINELKILLDRMAIDIWEVIAAASSKPFGFQPFYPGPGLGGHCIPIDPFYLSWKARQYEMNLRFIELAGEINTQMPHYVVSKIFEALNEVGQTIKGARILILGMAYKKDVDDIRESPALELLKLLIERKAEVCYHDPFIPVIPRMRHYEIQQSSVPLTAELLRQQNLVLIATDHSVYDYAWLVQESRLVVDTRNATQGVKYFRERIIKA